MHPFELEWGKGHPPESYQNIDKSDIRHYIHHNRFKITLNDDRAGKDAGGILSVRNNL